MYSRDESFYSTADIFIDAYIYIYPKYKCIYRMGDNIAYVQKQSPFKT